jgi:hypothetical protein
MDSHAILQFRVRIEEKAIASRQNHIAALNKMFTTKATNEDIDNLIMNLFPKPNKPQMVSLWEDNQDVLNGDSVSQTVDKRGQRANQLYQNAIERNEKYAVELVQRYHQFNDEFGYAAGTKYAAWQAITGFFNHSEQWQSEADVLAHNLFFGDKAKQQADAFAILIK